MGHQVAELLEKAVQRRALGDVTALGEGLQRALHEAPFE
jgi:hypothetical protein